MAPELPKCANGDSSRPYKHIHQVALVLNTVLLTARTHTVKISRDSLGIQSSFPATKCEVFKKLCVSAQQGATGFKTLVDTGTPVGVVTKNYLIILCMI